MNRDEMKHYGVKGMRWGVRKKRDGSGSGGKSSAKRSREVMRELQSARKAKSRSNADSDAALWEKTFDKAFKKEMAMENKKLKDIDASSSTKVGKVIKKLRVHADTKGLDRSYRQAELAVKNAKKQRKAAHRAETEAFERKMDQKYTSLYNKNVKGKPFMEGLKANNKISSAIMAEQLRGYAEIDAKHGLKG